MLKVSTSCLSKDGDNIITKYKIQYNDKNIFMFVSLADAAQLLSKFVAQLQRKIVAFIPTASVNEEHTQYVVDGKTALKYLGLVVKQDI